MQTNSNLTRLLLFSCLLLLFGLNGRELWSLETRWANIVLQMLQSHDYLHPLLKGELYYDKPLLSYWLIIASSKIVGTFSAFALRLPSALSAIASVYFIYAIGLRLFDRETGFFAAWLLITTFYFIFWGRVASADMLNVAGILAAVWWFFRDPLRTSFWNYVIFFQIIALTCLCKGLLGLVLTGLILLPYLCLHHLWRSHLNGRFLLAIIPAVIIYLIPFYLAEGQYQHNGLSLVIKENITRFFVPFDHKGPIYTYLIYLPVYLLPWTPLFFIALVKYSQQWKQQLANTRWLIWAIALLFAFFTASGSRRSYYILPLVPFAQLLSALLIKGWIDEKKETYLTWLRRTGMAFAIVFALFFGVAMPWYYTGGGLPEFGKAIKRKATLQDAWSQWQIVMIDIDNKVPFYVKNTTPSIYINSKNVDFQDHKQNVLTNLGVGQLNPERTIIIMPASEAAWLSPYLKHYNEITSTSTNGERLFHREGDSFVAYIPVANDTITINNAHKNG